MHGAGNWLGRKWRKMWVVNYQRGRNARPLQRRARSLEVALVGFYINCSCCIFKVILRGLWTSESKPRAVSFVTAISDARQDQQEGVHFSYPVSKTFKGCLLCSSKIIPGNLTRFAELLHKNLHLQIQIYTHNVQPNGFFFSFLLQLHQNITSLDLPSPTPTLRAPDPGEQEETKIVNKFFASHCACKRFIKTLILSSSLHIYFHSNSIKEYFS